MKKIVRASVWFLVILMILTVCINPLEVHATGEENPRVIVESYSLSTDKIIPGETTELTMRIRNTSKMYDAYTILVDVYDKTNSIFPVYGISNKIHIDRVYARNSYDVTIQLQAAEDIKDSVIPVEVELSYNDNYFIEKQTVSSYIYLPVKVDGDLGIVSCSVPESTSIGTKTRVSVTYENTGIKNINNIVLNVIPDKGGQPISTNLYSLGGTEKNTAEVYLDYGELGTKQIKIYFTYEDERGEQYETDITTYDIDVTDVEEEQYAENNIMIVGGGVSTITYVLCAAIIIMLIIILVIIKKRRR